MKIIQPKTYFYFTLGAPIFAALSLYAHLELTDVSLIFDNLFYVFLFPTFFPFLLLMYGLYLTKKVTKNKFIILGIIVNILVILAQIYIFYLITFTIDDISGPIPLEAPGVEIKN